MAPVNGKYLEELEPDEYLQTYRANVLRNAQLDATHINDTYDLAPPHGEY